MLDWLRRDPRSVPTLELAGRTLPVVIRRLDRARRMTMRLAPGGSEVRISIPRWGRTEEALDFARSRRDWLENQLSRLTTPMPVGDGATIPFRGVPLILRHDPGSRRKPALTESEIVIGGAQASLVPRLSRWLASEARTLLALDLQDYCSRAGRPPPKLALSGARRRWGSCSACGTIRINWRLVMAPDFVRRSVVAHEVAHLIHFDHSPAFHARLGELFEGNLAAANAWLKREGPTLYAHFG